MLISSATSRLPHGRGLTGCFNLGCLRPVKGASEDEMLTVTAILKFCSKTFSPRVPFLGGSFGPKENAIVQTVATSAGGLGGLFTSVVPALFQLGIFRDPIAEFPKLITLTFVTSYYGIMFAVPCKLHPKPHHLCRYSHLG